MVFDKNQIIFFKTHKLYRSKILITQNLMLIPMQKKLFDFNLTVSETNQATT